MKARIKFSKTGSMKFIGHLDVMRYFQKAFRRSAIDIEYSNGYSPHQLLSFAAPLGVGLTSEGEYLDISLGECESSEIMIEKINAVMAEGFNISKFKKLEDDSKKSMSLVAAADYLVSFKDGYDIIDDFSKKFMDFTESKEIIINKKTKRSEQEVDLKPLIYEINEVTNDSNYNTSLAETYTNGIKVFMKLATGSVNNLKPELVMEAFCNFLGIPYNKYSVQVHRIEVYANMSDSDDIQLVPLCELGMNL